jgi:hypothetical protein
LSIALQDSTIIDPARCSGLQIQHKLCPSGCYVSYQWRLR